MDRRTPLYNIQKGLGARFTSFGGWELPVSYTDILKEHYIVRNNAGLFDVSHMGEILVTGNDSISFVNGLITNNLEKVDDNRALYSPMCYEDGTVVDDIIIYKISDETLFLVVNAGNVQKDYEWITSHKSGNVNIENLSDEYIQLALQGPMSEKILKKVIDGDAELPRFFRFKVLKINGMETIVSRTGYTGEDGFEIYMRLTKSGADPEKLWNTIMEAGQDEGLSPIGLGARDTLRLEAALPLYGHELSDTITPLEVGLERFVKLDKPSFIGKEALLNQNREGIKRRLYGFEMEDKGIPRNGYDVAINGVKSGIITSGGPFPSLGVNGGLALIDRIDLQMGDNIEIIIRERPCKAKIASLPFYNKKYKK